MMKYLFTLVCISFSLLFYGQEQPKVDFIHADVNIKVSPKNKKVAGKVIYTFNALEKVDSVYLDAKLMNFGKVLLGGKPAHYSYDGKRITIKKRFKPNTTYRLSLSYSTAPKQAVYFIGWDKSSKNDEVWTQGQGKYTSNWLPSFDDMNEKVEFDMHITFDRHYEVIANGKLVGTQMKDSLKTWSFDMKHPISSYLLAFVMGRYHKKELTAKSGIPLELYYYPKDSLKIAPTYRYTQRIFDFMEAEIGVAYPWQNYKQIPVKDFLYAGMENTGTTIFSDAYMIDSTAFVDRNYVNVNAHELAHQWFGDMVTEKDGHHHWLQEGFATYYAYLAEKEIFGDDYFYWKLYRTAKEIEAPSKDGKGEALTNPKASSLTFYEKGAWALYMLRELMGDTTFKEGVHNYLEAYKFKNVTIEEFLEEMEKAGNMDLSDYKRLWLEGTFFPFETVKKDLGKASQSLQELFKLQRELTTSRESNESIIKKYWGSTNSNELKKEIITRYYKSLSPEFIKMAFKSNNVEIRQALAMSEVPILPSLKPEFESLLDDKSYQTIESTLYKLWIYFPEDRESYLNKTKNSIGLPNKNVRLLWLTLAILTKEYNPEKKEGYKAELRGYTSPDYSMEVRQGAFQYLKETIGFSNQNIKDLISACNHHSWQFKKYARGVLDEMFENPRDRIRIRTVSKELNGEELRYIENKLKEE